MRGYTPHWRVVLVLGLAASLLALQCAKEGPLSFEKRRLPAHEPVVEEGPAIVLTGGAEFRGGVDLSWIVSEKLQGAQYELIRRAPGDAFFNAITRSLLPAGTNRYKDHEVIEGEMYEYRVVAWLNGDPADSSDTATVLVAYPMSALYRLVRAYNTMDSDLFASCLAKDFRFYCVRGAEERGWGRDKEVHIHERMFGLGTPTDVLSQIRLRVSDVELHRESQNGEDSQEATIMCRVDLTCLFERSRRGYRSLSYEAPAEFEIRFNEAKGEWEILRWKDKESTFEREY